MDEKVLSLEDFHAMAEKAILEAMKEQGMDKIDRKHGIFPTTTEEEKSLPVETRFRNWMKGVMSRGRGDEAMVKELVEGSGSGSYVVPVEYANEVARAIGSYGKARRYCRVVNPTTWKLLIPDNTAGVTVAIAGESTAFSESDATITQKTLQLKVAGAISTFSNELLMDNNVNLLSVMASIYGEALAKFEDTHTFGTSTSYFTPMLKLSSGVTVTSDATSIANFTADDFQALRRGVDEKYWPGAMFFMHPYVLSYVEQIKDANSDYIVRQPANSGDVVTLWGHPVVTVSGMPSTDATASEFVGFGDPRFCWFGVGGNMEVSVSDQATLTTAGNLWEQYLSAIRVTERFGVVWTQEAGVSILHTAAA